MAESEEDEKIDVLGDSGESTNKKSCFPPSPLPTTAPMSQLQSSWSCSSNRSGHTMIDPKTYNLDRYHRDNSWAQLYKRKKPFDFQPFDVSKKIKTSSGNEEKAAGAGVLKSSKNNSPQKINIGRNATEDNIIEKNSEIVQCPTTADHRHLICNPNLISSSATDRPSSKPLNPNLKSNSVSSKPKLVRILYCRKPSNSESNLTKSKESHRVSSPTAPDGVQQIEQEKNFNETVELPSASKQQQQQIILSDEELATKLYSPNLNISWSQPDQVMEETFGDGRSGGYRSGIEMKLMSPSAFDGLTSVRDPKNSSVMKERHDESGSITLEKEFGTSATKDPGQSDIEEQGIDYANRLGQPVFCRQSVTLDDAENILLVPWYKYEGSNKISNENPIEIPQPFPKKGVTFVVDISKLRSLSDLYCDSYGPWCSLSNRCGTATKTEIKPRLFVRYYVKSPSDGSLVRVFHAYKPSHQNVPYVPYDWSFKLSQSKYYHPGSNGMFQKQVYVVRDQKNELHRWAAVSYIWFCQPHPLGIDLVPKSENRTEPIHSDDELSAGDRSQLGKKNSQNVIINVDSDEVDAVNKPTTLQDGSDQDESVLPSTADHQSNNQARQRSMEHFASCYLKSRKHRRQLQPITDVEKSSNIFPKYDRPKLPPPAVKRTSELDCNFESDCTSTQPTATAPNLIPPLNDKNQVAAGRGFVQGISVFENIRRANMIGVTSNHLWTVEKGAKQLLDENAKGNKPLITLESKIDDVSWVRVVDGNRSYFVQSDKSYPGKFICSGCCESKKVPELCRHSLAVSYVMKQKSNHLLWVRRVLQAKRQCQEFKDEKLEAISKWRRKKGPSKKKAQLQNNRGKRRTVERKILPAAVVSQGINLSSYYTNTLDPGHQQFIPNNLIINPSWNLQQQQLAITPPQRATVGVDGRQSYSYSIGNSDSNNSDFQSDQQQQPQQHFIRFFDPRRYNHDLGQHDHMYAVASSSSSASASSSAAQQRQQLQQPSNGVYHFQPYNNFFTTNTNNHQISSSSAATAAADATELMRPAESTVAVANMIIEQDLDDLIKEMEGGLPLLPQQQQPLLQSFGQSQADSPPGGTPEDVIDDGNQFPKISEIPSPPSILLNNSYSSISRSSSNQQHQRLSPPIVMSCQKKDEKEKEILMSQEEEILLDPCVNFEHFNGHDLAERLFKNPPEDFIDNNDGKDYQLMNKNSPVFRCPSESLSDQVHVDDPSSDILDEVSDILDEICDLTTLAEFMEF